MTIDLKNNFFSASLFFRSEINGKTDNNCLWEEVIVLISSDCEDSALKKAFEIGGTRNCNYENEAGEKINWIFHKVERIFSLQDSLENGCELFSRHLRNAEAESLLTDFED